MSQGIRDMLANRRFAIPLIVLLTCCLVGLILVGVVLVLRPGAGGDGEPTQVAGEVVTVSPTAEELATFTPAPTSTFTPTPRPSPTLVPVATIAGGASATPEATTQVEGGAETAEPAATATTAPTEATGGQATATTAAGQSAGAQVTATSAPADGQLAETGVGWGLILFSGAGLAGLAVAARRLRLAGN